MKQFRTLLFGLLLTSFSACSTDIPLATYLDPNAPLTIVVNTSNEQTGLTTSSTKTIPAKSIRFNNFMDWCKNNSKGWHSTYATYLGKVVVIQKDFRLFYNQGFVVVGFKDTNGKEQQYYRNVSKGELDFLTSNLVANQSSNEIQQMTVGVFCGECSNHCATMFRYQLGGNANTLWVDYTDSYFEKGEDNMSFDTQITDIKKYTLVNDILKHIPDSLLLSEKTSERFGCPDCSDGCGIYLEIVQNNKSKKFAIDYQTSELSGYIKEFAEYLKITIGKLKEKNGK